MLMFGYFLSTLVVQIEVLNHRYVSYFLGDASTPSPSGLILNTIVN